MLVVKIVLMQEKEKNMNNSELTLSQLEQYLSKAAWILKGPVDASDYKAYIFPLLFFKRISDVYDEEYQNALEESGNDKEYASLKEFHRFEIPKDCWVEDLYAITYQKSLTLFQDSLNKIINMNYELTPQLNLQKSRGSSLHFRNEINKLKKIDLSWDIDKIERYIRATSMNGFDPPFTVIGGKKIFFKKEYFKD